ncbi:MAG: asparagine--tRNA ligase [Syntrophobacterales bacterium]|nr:asparagine--tRNA ligase [Syntrophobacterales bacterium]
MEGRLSVREILLRGKDLVGQKVRICGWVRTRRDSKAGVSFVEINDGSAVRNLQAIIDYSRFGNLVISELLPRLHTGASIMVEGTIEPSPGKGQDIEILVSHIKVYGEADPSTYPLQKKRHSFEFLRQIAHLRPRTNTISAIMRLRSALSYAIHDFFKKRGFYYIHTPIITTSDCEGAGEVFRVVGGRNITEGSEFFGRPTYLTVSGQLQAEIYALALGKVYTFGPTFRAENSNTRRHLAEFWMVEPEMAFCDLDGDISLAKEFVTSMIEAMLSECEEEFFFFQKFIDEHLMDRLTTVLKKGFEVISYSDAIKILSQHARELEMVPSWGDDLQAEHERFLTEKMVRGPVIVIHYPRKLKPFYMRVNDDGETVSAMDLLVPGVGEIIGGSQREERVDVLVEQMTLKGMNIEDYEWYIDLRRYGSVFHAGFGLGLERFIQFLSGIQNIRETIPFPRTPGHALF